MRGIRRQRIGCVGGQSGRINERAIDTQWIEYLGCYADVVKIPSIRWIKLMGGPADTWPDMSAAKLGVIAKGLSELVRAYELDAIYANLPALTPYLLAARSLAGLPTGFLMIAHSVGSEHWLRHWLSITPFLCSRDVVLAATHSAKQALTNLSPVYEASPVIPLCIRVEDSPKRAGEPGMGRQGDPAFHILSIGRLEQVKNIDKQLLMLHEVRQHIPSARLLVAGDYTGTDHTEITEYRLKLQSLVHELGLEEAVSFTGPVMGEEKEELFRKADVLVNLSTDPGETFGFNLLEAKAWGIPVVCTGWDGIREVAEHGKDGLLISCRWSGDTPVFDYMEVAKQVVRLYQDRELARSMSDRAHWNAKRYSYKLIMPRVVEALDRALATDNPAGLQAALLTRPIGEQPEMYRLSELRAPELLNCNPLTVLRSTRMDRERWAAAAKPIIHHFPGSYDNVSVYHD
ncbi:glycosyltransferase family 4 protein [Paenibacillus mesotrionivorans]|uniref:Glycosyltransferase family 4 protein n=1 Tax=Paenibacillus mesotrionivorans TaxID=3160968 RepID=A0ACC7NWK9_9BACL